MAPAATPSSPPRPWVLPDDGIIDELAIEIAASGTRKVALTIPERRLAAALILAKGGTTNQICVRLSLTRHAARALTAEAAGDAA